MYKRQVVFYTDGVIEGRRDGTFFGQERFADVVSDNQQEGCEGVVEAVVREVVAFQEGAPRDDIVLVAIAVP